MQDPNAGFRSPVTIRIKSSEAEPLATVKRQLLKTNLGVYCKTETCRQFIAVTVIDPVDGAPIATIEGDPPGAPIWLKCSMCGTVSGYHGSNFAEVLLRESNKQRPHSH